MSQRVLEEVRTGADAPSTGTLVASGRQRSARMTWRSWSVVATAAAVVVVAVFAWQQLGTDRATDRVVVDNSSESTDRVAEEAPQAPPPVAVSKGDVEQTADEATTSEEPNEVADPGEVFLALVGLSPVTGAGRTANANAAGAANGLDNPMTEGLRQVGDSTAGALGRLLDAFPVPENPSS